MSGSSPRGPGEAQLSPVLELELAREIDAPGRARAAVGEIAERLRLGAPTLQTLVLLVSEVVSNAVLHSTAARGEPIGLAVSVTDDALRVIVSDAGGGFIPRRRDPASIGDGYGLYLVDKTASRWGVEVDGRTCVWFEVLRDAG